MKIITKEFNIITGEETLTERDETAAEKKERLDRETLEARNQAELEANAVKRAAILEKLGITAEEAKLLLS